MRRTSRNSFLRKIRFLGVSLLCAGSLGLAGCDSDSSSDNANNGGLISANGAFLGANGPNNNGNLNGGNNVGGPRNPGPGNGVPVPFQPGGGGGGGVTGGRIFISHRASTTVGIYDATSYALLETVEVGSSPEGLAFDSERGRVIVTLDDGTVVTFAAHDPSDTSTFATGNGFPADVAYDPINDAIFVPHRFGPGVQPAVLSAVNAGDFSPLPNFPVTLSQLVEVRVDATGERVFSIQNNGGPVLFVVDIASGTLVGNPLFPAGHGTLDGLAYDSSPERVFVNSFGSGNLLVFNASAPLPVHIQTIPTGSSPTSVAVDNTNKRVYVANLGSGDVTVYDDAETPNDPLSFNRTLATDGGPIGVHYDDQRNRILTTNEGADSISVYNATTFEPVGVNIRVGDGPYVILVEPAAP